MMPLPAVTARKFIPKEDPLSCSWAEAWDKRYRLGGGSGYGSTGILADYKIKIINDFITSFKIKSIIDFGCGDGYISNYIEVQEYLGLDISKTAIEICEKNNKKVSKKFKLLSEYKGETADSSISLDVIYHLVEENDFRKHIKDLFMSANSFCLIYSNRTQGTPSRAPHIRWIDWARYVSMLVPYAIPLKHIPNPFSDLTGCDFFLYEIDKKQKRRGLDLK